MENIEDIMGNAEDTYSVFGEVSRADLVELVDVMKQREIKSAEDATREQQHMLEESLRNSAMSLVLQARAEEIQVKCVLVSIRIK